MDKDAFMISRHAQMLEIEKAKSPLKLLVFYF